MPMVLLYALLAAGTVHSNSTDEAVLGSYEFPRGFWQAGKVVRGRALVRTTSSNATDTLTVYLRFGAVALTGTAVVTTGAVDQANGDGCVIDFEFVCRDADDSSEIVATAYAPDPDADGIAVKSYFELLTGVDTEASTYLAVTADWSVAHADNDVYLESLTIYEAMPSDVS
jgi:hypothetical protein